MWNRRKTRSDQLLMFVLFVISALIVGCGDDGGTPRGAGDTGDIGLDGDGDLGADIPPRQYCGTEHPDGECVSSQICLDGACVDRGLLCSSSQLQGACSHGGSCINGRCFGADEVCSERQTIGVCPTNQFCNLGACAERGECGPNPLGQCNGGETCWEGTCRPVSETCSVDNPTGDCRGDLVCLEGSCLSPSVLCAEEVVAGRCPSGESCAGGQCLPIQDACGLHNPSGACGHGLQCLEGACRDPGELCSASNPFGFCAEGLSCIEGECRAQTQTCSYEVFDGVCPQGLTCSAGHCDGPVACGPQFPFGDCPMGQTCLCDPVSTCSDGHIPADATTAQIIATRRANEYRNAIGLWSIAGSAPIHQAATAHAEYLAFESMDGHSELVTDSPYFTGVSFGDRLRAAGYTGRPLSEVIAYTGDPVAAVDELIATVYHREPFFDPLALEMGYGGADGPRGAANVINFGRAERSCLSEVVVVYPPHESENVAISWHGRENPQPPPPPGGYPSGPVISVHGSAELDVDEHTIKLGDTEIPHTELWSGNDPDISAGHYFMYPHAPLLSATEYEVTVTGRHGGAPFHLRWSFTTAP